MVALAIRKYRRKAKEMPSGRAAEGQHRTARMRKPDRRIQLLRIAQDIIEQEGMGGLTMSALAERSGAAKPVVYEHFSNSEAVAVAVIDEYFQQVSKFVVDIVDRSSSIKEYMGLLVDALFDFRSTNSLNIRKVTNGFSSNHIELNKVYRRYMQRSTDIFVSLLRAQSVPEDIAVPAAYGLQEMIGAVVYEFSDHADTGRAREALKAMLSGIMQSLVPQHKTRPVTPPELIGSLLVEAGESEAQ